MSWPREDAADHSAMRKAKVTVSRRCMQSRTTAGSPRQCSQCSRAARDMLSSARHSRHGPRGIVGNAFRFETDRGHSRHCPLPLPARRYREADASSPFRRDASRRAVVANLWRSRRRLIEGDGCSSETSAQRRPASRRTRIASTTTTAAPTTDKEACSTCNCVRPARHRTGAEHSSRTARIPQPDEAGWTSGSNPTSNSRTARSRAVGVLPPAPRCLSVITQTRHHCAAVPRLVHPDGEEKTGRETAADKATRTRHPTAGPQLHAPKPDPEDVTGVGHLRSRCCPPRREGGGR